MNDKNYDVSNLLDNLFSENRLMETSLKNIFERRLTQLDISQTTSLKILGIESRTLNGVLNGTLKLIDFTVLIKLSNFLQIPQKKVISLFLAELEKNFPDSFPYPSDKIEYINKNFDLAALKKSGIIDSITDYYEIDNSISSFLGIKTIFEYQPSVTKIAFSAGVIKPKNNLSRTLWIERAKNIFNDIENPHSFDRDRLIDFFGEIRWHSTNIELGFINVVQTLYNIGITVIFQTSLPSIHLRGATFSVYGKPCIVITDYKGFYPTLWFALIHELFHVLFDWEEIRNSKQHISEENTEEMSVLEREQEADSFARDYLFSREKLRITESFIQNPILVEKYAKNNHVHPSFIYLFGAKEKGDNSRVAWNRVHKYNPDISPIIDSFGNWKGKKPKTISETVVHLKTNIFK